MTANKMTSSCMLEYDGYFIYSNILSIVKYQFNITQGGTTHKSNQNQISWGVLLWAPNHKANYQAQMDCNNKASHIHKVIDYRGNSDKKYSYGSMWRVVTTYM